MGILDEALAEPPGGRSRSKVVAAMESLATKDRDELEQALRDPRIGNEALARVLKRRGLEVSADSIRAYRMRRGLLEPK